MKTKVIVGIVLLALVALFLSACAPGPNPLTNVPAPGDGVANFWLGLWQGFIAPVTFIISLFNSTVSFYEVHNDGIPYNIGFVIGAVAITGGLFGGGARGSRR
jgi:hypothetical protein